MSPRPRLAPEAEKPEPPRKVAAPRGRKATRRPGVRLQPIHLGIIGIVLATAVGLAVYLARPEAFGRSSRLQLEEVPLAQELSSTGSASIGDLQVAGIRTLYGDGYKPKVRAVVINHSGSSRRLVNLEVQLRSPRAGPSSSPLASFVIELDDELGPYESREIETDLIALGTLAAFPHWDEIDIRLETRSADASAAGDQ